MKGLSLFVCLATLTVSSVQAGTVTLTSVGERQFTDANGNALPAGSTIRVGTFDLTQPKAAGGVLAALVAWKTRNTMLTIIVGIGVVMAIEALT